MSDKIYPVSFVPMPIGNRKDITQRALEVLSAVDSIACEDTRHSAPLLTHWGIRKPLVSLHEHNEHKKAGEIADRALAGETFAVVTDAGMPGISDPGYRLLQVLRQREIKYTVLPGPSAVITALVGSGMPSDAFFFGGFLPVKKGKRGSVLEKAIAETHTSIFLESPHRLAGTLELIAALDPEVPLCIARELTKTFETYHRGSAEEMKSYFDAHPPKGEMVFLVGGTNCPRSNAGQDKND